jgi:hypothetical protein
MGVHVCSTEVIICLANEWMQSCNDEEVRDVLPKSSVLGIRVILVQNLAIGSGNGGGPNIQLYGPVSNHLKAHGKTWSSWDVILGNS